jgi:uncharacterized membrane protein YesL
MDFLNLLQWLAVLAVALFIYLDATGNKIGRVKGERALINFPAGLWAALVFLVVIVGLPLYLFFRSRLIGRAKDHPIILTPKHKKKTLAVLAVLGLAISVVASIPSLWPA